MDAERRTSLIAPARALAVVLAGLIGLFYGVSRQETVPAIRPLTELPPRADEWQMTYQGTVEPEILAELKADDTVNRVYSNAGERASLYIAFFKSQRTGVVPHSPKHCLPANGWLPEKSEIMYVSVPGRSEPIAVNRYLVSRGTDKSVVLYWYQSPYRVVASEYAAKVYLVLDALRYNRTDTSMVRVIVPVGEAGEERAEAAAVRFLRSVFPSIQRHLSG